MRLLSHTPAASRDTTVQAGVSWVRPQRVLAPSGAEARGTSSQEAEAERLARANGELRDALVKLIAFAGPRTAQVNESGDRILDPQVVNAKAVLVAVDAGL